MAVQSAADRGATPVCVSFKQDVSVIFFKIDFTSMCVQSKTFSEFIVNQNTINPKDRGKNIGRF